MFGQGSNRFLTFIYGLVLGLLLGATIVLWKIADRDIASIVERSTQQVLKRVVDETSKLRGIADDEEDEKPKPQTSRKNKQSKDSLAVSQNDSNLSALASKPVDVVVPKDTLPVDSPVSENISTMDEIVIIRKDEMVGTRIIEIVTHEPNEETKKDSSLSNLSGIRETKGLGTSIKIEFWKSPLNYKGYKLSRNLLVVYGIHPAEQMKIVKHDGKVFMRSGPNVYRLDFTSEFKPFEKLRDEAFINSIEGL